MASSIRGGAVAFDRGQDGVLADGRLLAGEALANVERPLGRVRLLARRTGRRDWPNARRPGRRPTTLFGQKRRRNSGEHQRLWRLPGDQGQLVTGADAEVQGQQQLAGGHRDSLQQFGAGVERAAGGVEIVGSAAQGAQPQEHRGRHAIAAGH